MTKMKFQTNTGLTCLNEGLRFRVNLCGLMMSFVRHIRGIVIKAFTLGLTTASVCVQAQNLFEADWGNGSILQFSPTGTKTVFASGLDQAVALAFDGSTNLFVATGYDGVITKITPDGTQSTFASGLSYPFGVACDVFGNIYEADMGSGNIYKFAPNGTQSPFISGLGRPAAVAIDSAGNLFVADQLPRGQTSGNIYKFTPSGQQSTVVSGITQPNGMAFNHAGDLFLAGEYDGNIYKITLDDNQSVFASGLRHPTGIAMDDNDNLFVTDIDDGNIYKYTPDGTKSVFASGLDAANGLAFQRSPGSLNPRILKVPADYPSIQRAINAASWFVVDTVLVSNGVYYENLDFGGKAITVASVNGPEVTIIDGSQTYAAVNFGNGEDTDSLLTGFTLTNSTSGVNVSSTSPTISSNVIVNCGTGIACYSGSPVILNNVISNSTGSAIYFFDTSSPLLANNVIMANQGGGVNMFVAGSPTICNNLIQGNGGDGIGMVNQSDANIIQNIIIGNAGNGIYALVPDSDRGPYIINNTIECNQASGINEDGFPSNSLIENNIVVGTPAITISPWYGLPPAIIRFNDFYSPVDGTVYNGDAITNLTGLNGNISIDSWFACEPEGDYHLLAGSPCIDAGTNDLSYLPLVDFDGNSRILAGSSNNISIVDMGAYEFNPLIPPMPCMFIDCQTDIVVYTAPGQNSAVVNFPIPRGTPVATITCSPPSGSTFYGGTNLVTCTATYGPNRANCSFNVVVVLAPTIMQQPQNLQVYAGQNFTLSVGVSGTPPMYYQWSYQGNPIYGANAASLTINDAQAANDGVYSVQVYNAAGATNSGLARVRVQPAKPVIVTNPMPTTVSAGSNACFSVAAVGSEPFAYQWYYNQHPIAGGTYAQLWLTNVQAGNAGNYSVVVSNLIGQATSKPAKLTVRPAAPYFVVQPASATLLYGAAETLSSLAAGSEPMHYQWYFQRHPLPGQTRPQLNLPAVTPAVAGNYFVVAMNSYGKATSSVAQLTVNVPPLPVRLLTNQVVKAGQRVVLAFAAFGDAPLTYSWQFNGSAMACTNPVLVVTNIQLSQAGYYQVTASNAFGTYSSTAKISILGPASRLVAWGDNSGGQASIPTGLSNVVVAAGGDFHSIAIRVNGTLAAWGDNSDGQSTIPAHLPAIVSVAAGASHNLAIGANGSLFAWGNNASGQCNIPSSTINQPLSVSAGDVHSLALLANGTVVAWGDNTYGQIDLPDVLTLGYWWWWGYYYWPNPNWVPASTIAAGRNHNLAILTNGVVVAWGDNSYGQCNVPPDLTNALAVAGGYLHSVALRTDGTVTAWGDNSYGQTNVPPGLTNVMAVSAGDFNTLALLVNGRVVGWGDNSYGQDTIPAGVTNAVEIVSGYYHSMALIPAAPPLFSERKLLSH